MFSSRIIYSNALIVRANLSTSEPEVVKEKLSAFNEGDYQKVWSWFQNRESRLVNVEATLGLADLVLARVMLPGYLWIGKYPAFNEKGQLHSGGELDFDTQLEVYKERIISRLYEAFLDRVAPLDVLSHFLVMGVERAEFKNFEQLDNYIVKLMPRIEPPDYSHRNHENAWIWDLRNSIEEAKINATPKKQNKKGKNLR